MLDIGLAWAQDTHTELQRGLRPLNGVTNIDGGDEVIGNDRAWPFMRSSEVF